MSHVGNGDEAPWAGHSAGPPGAPALTLFTTDLPFEQPGSWSPFSPLPATFTTDLSFEQPGNWSPLPPTPAIFTTDLSFEQPGNEPPVAPPPAIFDFPRAAAAFEPTPNAWRGAAPAQMAPPARPPPRATPAARPTVASSATPNARMAAAPPPVPPSASAQQGLDTWGTRRAQFRPILDMATPTRTDQLQSSSGSGGSSQLPARLPQLFTIESISAMPEYQLLGDTSHEELRWADYQAGYSTRFALAAANVSAAAAGGATRGAGNPTTVGHVTGTYGIPYRRTPADSDTSDADCCLMTVTAMPAFGRLHVKSHEELRWEDLQLGIKSGAFTRGQNQARIRALAGNGEPVPSPSGDGAGPSGNGAGAVGRPAAGAGAGASRGLDGLCCVCMDQRAEWGFVHSQAVHLCLCGACHEEMKRRGRVDRCLVCNARPHTVAKVVVT